MAETLNISKIISDSVIFIFPIEFQPFIVEAPSDKSWGSSVCSQSSSNCLVTPTNIRGLHNVKKTNLRPCEHLVHKSISSCNHSIPDANVVKHIPKPNKFLELCK